MHHRVFRTNRVRAVEAMFHLRGCGRGVGGKTATATPPAVPLGPGSITLITGTSGAGKSTLLRHLRKRLAHKRFRVKELSVIPLPGDRALVDCFAQPLHETLALLARAGLAEAHLFSLPPAHLSEGEQFRFRLARWMAETSKAKLKTQKSKALLLADEFCSTLDRITARAVAWQFARFVREVGACAIVATAHDDLAEDLQPDAQLRMELGGAGNEEIRN